MINAVLKIIHNNKLVVSVYFNDEKLEIQSNGFAENIFFFSKQYPEAIIVWYDQNVQESINFSEVKSLLANNKSIIHWHTSENNFLNKSLGFVDLNSFLNFNKSKLHFNRQISATCGAAAANVFNSITNKEIYFKDLPNYFLHSIGKNLVFNGLFCYHQPKLFKTNIQIKNQTSTKNTYQFVKQHYRFKWLLFLFFHDVFFQFKWPVFSFLRSLFYRKRDLNPEKFISFPVVFFNENKNPINTIDVIIPTIGRKDYVKNFLTDLKNQTVLPNKIIIVEQNPLENSKSELDFLETETWPFEIDLIFTQQTGACNARNLALKKAYSHWVFLADDDISIQNNFFETILNNEHLNKKTAFNLACLQKNEKKLYQHLHQTTIFGSGTSFVATEAIKNASFNNKYEFCFGEDFDFGMQLRNNEIDVLSVPNPEILHYKAPIGGFRIKPILPWSIDEISPKPSPTILLNQLKYKTIPQQLAFKTLYFLEQLKYQPFGFFKINKQWKQSEKWANKLLND